ncbi:MAG TPA: fatty acid desaturase [Candidatus Baltobacteraceae bacterium]
MAVFPKRAINWPIAASMGFIHLGALAVFIPALFAWSSVLGMAIICVLTSAVGVSLCFHRSLTHRGLRLAKPLEYATALLGTLALQGGPITWVSTHRAHHAATDKDGDPHGADRGFFWSHCEWLIRRNEAVPNHAERRRLAPELVADPFYRFLDRNNVQLQIALGILLFFVGGWSLVVWGIFVRLVLMYHSTWLVNSASHMFGYRTYKTDDMSRNNWWVALLSWGEGWHNNHHAFQFSARLGLRWFEIDIVWWLIRVLKLVRLVDAVKVPSREMRDRLLLAAPRVRTPAVNVRS